MGKATREPTLRLYGGADNELIVDSFAGGGGASLGISMALGRGPDIAINHDAEAIALHKANHPETQHYTEDVWRVDPKKACAGRPVGLMWASPDCKHFSKAKGGKPVSKRVRGLAWVVVRWAASVKPRVIFLENVEEFQTWGPVLANGQPCKIQKGRTFRAFKRKLERLGYEVQFRELRATIAGTPTIRKRLYMIARCDGRPIVWPAATHGDAPLPKGGVAADCIEWSIPCPSIFERKKALATNTLKRIARGIQRFVIDAPRPFIVQIQNASSGDKPIDITRPMPTITAHPKGGGHALVVIDRIEVRDGSGNLYDEQTVVLPQTTPGPNGGGQTVAPIIAPLTHHGENRGQRADEPIATITGAHRGEQAVISAVLAGVGGRAGQSPERPMTEPVATITAKGDTAIVAPLLVRTAHGEIDKSGKKRGKGEHSLELPLGAVTASGDHAVIAAHITKFRNGATGSDLNEPVPTVTANGFVKRPGGAAPLGLAAATLVQTGYGEREGQAPRVLDIEKPLGTVVSGAAKHALVTSFIAKHFGDTGQRPGSALDEPLGTVTAESVHHALTTAVIAKHYGGHESPGADLRDPLPTVTTQDHNHLVAGTLINMRGTHDSQLGGRSMNEPMPTISGGGIHAAEVRAFMVAYYGNEKDGGPITNPMRTVTSKDRLGLVLVTVDGVTYYIADIGMRMLQPRELYRAQGFPDSYRIDIKYPVEVTKKVKGKPVTTTVMKNLTKTGQVRMCGNSVCPPMARLLVLANCADMVRPVAVAA